MTPETFLLDVCNSLYFPLRISIRSEKTRYQYRLAIRTFGESLGRIAAIDDLHDDLLTIWMGRLLDSGLAVDTVRERVGRIQTLWSWLAKRGMITRWPTILRPPAPDPLPQALTEDQLRRLFRSAGKERGFIGGIPSDLWWISFFAFIWNTSERKGAALSVRVEWLDLERRICKIPPDVRKGARKWGIYELWPETIVLLRRVIAANQGSDLVWPWDRHEGSYYTAYNRILRDAGIPVTRKTKTHGLRCSHATWLKVAGGDPMAQLGHSDMATTIRHYLDPTFSRTQQPKLFIPWQHPDSG